MNKQDFEKYSKIICGCPLFAGIAEGDVWALLEGAAHNLTYITGTENHEASPDNADDAAQKRDKMSPGLGCEIYAVDENSHLDSAHMYIVLAGTIFIEKDASDGRTITMRRANAGEVVNAAAVLEPGSNLSVLHAGKDCVVLEVSENVVKSAISAGGTFALNFARYLTGRIRFLNHKISSLAGYSAYSRMLMYLEEHAADEEVVLPMSISDFADYLGVGRASLYRALDTLESNGTIRRKGRRIYIKKDEEK